MKIFPAMFLKTTIARENGLLHVDQPVFFGSITIKGVSVVYYENSQLIRITLANTIQSLSTTFHSVVYSQLGLDIKKNFSNCSKEAFESLLFFSGLFYHVLF